MEQLNLKYKAVIEADMEQNQRTAREALNYLEHSTAKYKGETIYSLYMAKLFTEEALLEVKSAAETMYGILIKVMNQYLNQEAYRNLFGFSKKMEYWICKHPGYQNLLPITRVDIFLNETDLSYWFCEFNADGCSSMNEDRELNQALQLTAAYQELAKQYQMEPFELFDSWVAAFTDIYATYQHRVEHPKIAIVDFMEKGCSIEEFREFQYSFQKAGYKTQICEIRDLTYDGVHLYAKDGMQIDAVYRRAVTSDVFEHEEEVQAFLHAIEEEKVCVIGNFCTQIIHDKVLFSILHLPETKQFLTAQENEFIRQHIPYTVRLTDEMIHQNHVLEQKEKWLIKPEDSYGAKNIFPGFCLSTEEWSTALEQHKNKDYMLQSFILPYSSYNIDFKKRNPEFKPYRNLTGLFVYDGKFAGIYSRQSEHEIISTNYDENDIASVVARRNHKLP